jgi:hypothetical protein
LGAAYASIPYVSFGWGKMTLSLFGCIAYNARWFVRIGHSSGVSRQGKPLRVRLQRKTQLSLSCYPVLFQQNENFSRH